MNSIQRNKCEKAVKGTVEEFGPIKQAQFGLTMALLADDPGKIEQAMIRLGRISDDYEWTDEQYDAAVDHAYEQAVIFTAEY